MRRRARGARRPESGEFRCMSYSPVGGPRDISSQRWPSRTRCAGRTRAWGHGLGTERGLETRLVPERGYELALIPAVPLPRKPTAELLTVPGRLRGTIKAAEQILERTKADAVVGFGGYVALPGYLAAKRLGVPIVVHEANARPGLANRSARGTPHRSPSPPRTASSATPATSASRCAATSPPSTGPRSAREARAAFGLDPNLPTLLVSGGSQGARRLNEVVQQVAPSSSRPASRSCTRSARRTNCRRSTTCPGCRRTSRYRTWTGWTSRTPRPT